ncbi:MAG TPA: hypothetical protein VKA68_00590, partial [bacterium]|nr:hypothetical protein [bacterium]
MSPDKYRNIGNNHQADGQYSILEPLQRVLESRLVSYSQRHVTLPENLKSIPIFIRAGTSDPHVSAPLVNKIIDFLEYLVGDRFAVSQLVGYQGEMVFLRPFRGMPSFVFNVNVDTSLSFVENLFLQYFRVWQQQASTLNMITRIQQTGTLTDTRLSASSGVLRSVKVLPQPWQLHSGISPSDYPSRKVLAQNLSAIYDALHQFEYNRLNRYMTGYHLHTVQERSREGYGQPRDAVFVIASAANRFGRPQDVAAHETMASDELPFGAQPSFAGFGQSDLRGSITLT